MRTKRKKRYDFVVDVSIISYSKFDERFENFKEQLYNERELIYGENVALSALVSNPEFFGINNSNWIYLGEIEV